ncbi:MAG: Ig-like domain-containing protein [Gemmatimonadales bacterium]
MMRRYVTVVGTAALLVGACSGDGSSPQGAYQLTVSAGDAQTDTVGKTLPAVYVVLVADSAGTPAAGVVVAWSVTGGGGTITATSTSDGAGIARAIRTLGTVAGPQTAQAVVGGVSVIFTATALAGPPTQRSKNAGDAQSAAAGSVLPVPFAVLVQDQHDNPVESVTVNWTVASGGGSLSVPSSKTNGSGIARVTLTLGPDAGPNGVSATVPGIAGAIAFSATAVVQPLLVKSLPITENYGIHDMYVRDGLAFVFAWNTGVLIYDVGNGMVGGSPSQPTFVGAIVTSDGGIVGGAAVHNGWWFHNPVTSEKKYLFIGQEGPAFGGGIGSESSGLIHVVDVSDLANPQEVAFFHKAGTDSTGTHNFWMDEARQILYAAYYNGGVVALDVSGNLVGDLANRLIDSIRPGGVGNTYVWGVQLYNGSLYASDMLSGLWQLDTTGAQLTVAAGGNNVPERFSSDLWVANGYAYTGTWGFRAGSNFGNAVKIWQIGAGGAPALVDSIVTSGISTVSDVEVSDNGNLLMFSTENGPNSGFWFYRLTDPAHPTFIAKYLVSSGVHTATFSRIGGKLYAFGAKDPSGAALIILDVSSLDP